MINRFYRLKIMSYYIKMINFKTKTNFKINYLKDNKINFKIILKIIYLKDHKKYQIKNVKSQILIILMIINLKYQDLIKVFHNK